MLTGYVFSPQFALSSAFSYRFAEVWPAWWLIAGGLVLLAYLVYRRETGTALPKHKLFLGTLRALALLLVLAMIFRPVLVSQRSHIKDSVLAVMVDTSQSMQMQDKFRNNKEELALAKAAGIAPQNAEKLTAAQHAQFELLDRRRLVEKVLNNSGSQFLQELKQKCTPRLYTFSSSAKQVELPAGEQDFSFEPDGKTTAVGEAIREVVRDLKGQRIAGLVIITDGQSNIGRDPESAAKQYALNREEPFPVFTVGVGSSYEPKDIEVLQIFGNDTVFARDFILFNVAVNSKGFSGKRVRLTIETDDTVLASENVELTGDELQQIPVRFKAKAGRYECRAKIEPEPDEITTENNVSPPHLLEVVDRPVQVLVVSDEPTWEYRYLKNYLMRDTSVKVSLLLQSADPDFFQEGTQPISEFPATREELFEYDVVILLGANASRLTDADFRNLQAFVETVGGGLMVTAQEECPPSMYSNTPLEKLLPVVPGPAPYFDPLRDKPVVTQSFRASITASGLQHPITALAVEENQNENVWETLPGLFYYFPAEKLKPAAVALLEHPTEGNENGKYPLMAAQPYGSGRVVYIGVDSTWRWRFRRSDRYFGRFWGQAIRFLSSGKLLGSKKRLNVASDKPSYILGQKVTLHARSLDRFYEPTREENLQAKLSSSEFEEKDLTMKAVPGSPGMFRGEFTPSKPGRYTVKLRTDAGDSATESSASFVVRMPSLEYDHPGMNAQLLHKIASATDGRYLSLAQIDQISGELEKLREEYTSEEQHDIWDNPVFLLLVAGLVVTEWAVRKRKMLA